MVFTQDGYPFFRNVEDGGRLGSTSSASSDRSFSCSHVPKCPLPLETSSLVLFLILRKLYLERENKGPREK